MSKKVHAKRLSIPSYWEIIGSEQPPKSSQKRIHNKIKQDEKYKTSRNSPTIKKVKRTAATKYSTRQSSPFNTVSKKSTPPRSKLGSRVPSHVIKKKKNSKKIPVSKEKLSVIQGKELKYAPKIYENQIFCDVYDDEGHHDRIMEIEESLNSQLFSPVVVYPEFVETHKEDRSPRPPTNSFLETCQDSFNSGQVKDQAELFAKLELLAKNQQSDD